MGVGSPGKQERSARAVYPARVFREEVHATRDILGEVFRDSAHGSLSGEHEGGATTVVLPSCCILKR